MPPLEREGGPHFAVEGFIKTKSRSQLTSAFVIRFDLLFKKRTIHFDIFVCTLAPAHITFKCTFNKNVPILAVICVNTSVNSAEHIVCVISLECKSVALSVAAVGDRVLKTSCFTNDRQCAVAKRNHLRKSARLALAWHKE